jgi:hypothetical protein
MVHGIVPPCKPEEEHMVPVRSTATAICVTLALFLVTPACSSSGGTGTPDVLTPDAVGTGPDTVGPDGSPDAIIEDGVGTIDGGDAGADAGPDGPPAFECTTTSDVPCQDQSFQDLTLYDTVNMAAVTEDMSGEPNVFLTHIDTTAGGQSPTMSYVYVKFTDTGVMRLDLSDSDAFASTDWHMAFRRFVIRLNSGVSGPSCVTGARTAGGTMFDAVTTPPDGLEYRTEQYYTNTCGYVSDGSGIGSPGTALASFWTYPGCVQMTGNVYIIQLNDGRHIKLQVVDYYTPDVQMACQQTGMLPSGMPSGAGNVRIMWAFLD